MFRSLLGTGITPFTIPLASSSGRAFSNAEEAKVVKRLNIYKLSLCLVWLNGSLMKNKTIKKTGITTKKLPRCDLQGRYQPPPRTDLKQFSLV